jgi:hypothetical protein
MRAENYLIAGGRALGAALLLLIFEAHEEGL